MSRRPHARRFLALVGGLLLPLTLSCVARTTRTYDDLAPGGPSGSISHTLAANPAQARLQSGQQALVEGRYADAERSFKAVYAEGGAKMEWRAEALYGLSRVHSYFLNPARDVAKARALLLKLPEEFPNAPIRADAAKLLATLPAAPDSAAIRP
jgi:hypothetical protein